MDSEFEDVERTLCQLPQVHVFKIPMRKTADGHRASDWPKDPNWTGKLKIIAKGNIAAIILQDEKNGVFATCKVTDEFAVERTLDSGRYFVLRITNQQGRHAFIGIAFNERNDAFDFNIALSEFKNEIERETKISAISSAPPVDLSLKSGEKIKIKLNAKKKDPDSLDTNCTINSGKTPLILNKSAAKFESSDPFSMTTFSGDIFSSFDDLSSSNSGLITPIFAGADPFACGDPFANIDLVSSNVSNQSFSDFADF